MDPKSQLPAGGYGHGPPFALNTSNGSYRQ